MHSNLFASAKLCRGAANAEAKALPLGAARCSSRGGLPAAFLLEEKTKKERKKWLAI